MDRAQRQSASITHNQAETLLFCSQYRTSRTQELTVTESRQSDHRKRDRREYPDIRQEHHRTSGSRSLQYFISEGGKIWPRIKAVAEANNCVPHMLEVLQAA